MEAQEQALSLDRERFLSRHWQREPLLIRDAIANFSVPLSKHELAGLALEHSVESRIIEHGPAGWAQHNGPFDEADFQRDHPWSLLVQAVDHYVEGVAALRKLIDFIPQWRVDDVMVSYAVDGGGVGPHYDNYDVFLLQGEGQRLWQLGAKCDPSTPLLPHSQLRILENFEPEQEFLLNPGDILYVPPGVAHCGTARGECTTFSLGFRAPRVRDMVARWVDLLLENIDPELFFSDPGRPPMARPGEITPRDVERATAILQHALENTGGNSWFGELVTQPRDDFDAQDAAEGLKALQGAAAHIELFAGSKLAWQKAENGAIQVFANGEMQAFRETVLPCLLVLCQDWALSGPELSRALDDPETYGLLAYLVESGVLYVL